MAEVTQPAKTRYTPDQTAISEAVVQYSGLRPEDPAGTLKIVGWGERMAPEVEKLVVGQRVVLEGRLRMNTVERPEGFKEKLVELSVSAIYAMADPAVGHEPAENYAPAQPQATPSRKPAPKTVAPVPAMAAVAPDQDDISF